MIWKRPEGVPFPSIWRRFEGRKLINGNVPKFWVQDIPECLFEKCVEIMCVNFIYDEPLSRYANFSQDKASVDDLKEIWRAKLHDKVGLICFMENPDPHGKPIIAGMNMTYVSQKEEKLPESKGTAWTKILDTILYFCSEADPYEKFSINEYMGSFGLSVIPEFQRQGIALELLRARSNLGKAVGLKATTTVFSATASQIVAERAGFKDLIAMTYDELARKKPEFSYPGISEHNKSIRYMYKLI